MTSHFRRVALGGFVFAATLIWGSTPSHAISCIGAGEVTSLALAGCDLGPLHFDSFAVTAAGQNNFNAALFLGGAPFTNVTTEQTSGGQATLGFQVAHSPAPTTGFADILLSYHASTLSGNVLLARRRCASRRISTCTRSSSSKTSASSRVHSSAISRTPTSWEPLIPSPSRPLCSCSEVRSRASGQPIRDVSACCQPRFASGKARIVSGWPG